MAGLIRILAVGLDCSILEPSGVTLDLLERGASAHWLISTFRILGTGGERGWPWVDWWRKAVSGDCEISPRNTAWYQKPKATFADCWALVRRHLWRVEAFREPDPDPRFAKIRRTDLNRLVKRSVRPTETRKVEMSRVPRDRTPLRTPFRVAEPIHGAEYRPEAPKTRRTSLENGLILPRRPAGQKIPEKLVRLRRHLATYQLSSR